MVTVDGLAQEESLTFQSQLDRLEAEILTQRQELRDLQVMNNDAHLSKDTAKVTLLSDWARGRRTWPYLDSSCFRLFPPFLLFPSSL